jgi:hypothetical protein
MHFQIGVGMKRIFAVLLLALTTLCLLAPGAEARRLGSGGSYGRQSSRVTPPMRQAQPLPSPAPGYSPSPAPAPSYARPAPAPAPAAPYPQPVPQAARPSGMGGMLGGALLGLGLGSMLGHGAATANGMPVQGGGGGGGLLTIIIIAGLAYFLYRRFRR